MFLLSDCFIPIISIIITHFLTWAWFVNTLYFWVIVSSITIMKFLFRAPQTRYFCLNVSYHFDVLPKHLKALVLITCKYGNIQGRKLGADEDTAVCSGCRWFDGAVLDRGCRRCPLLGFRWVIVDILEVNDVISILQI